MEENKPEDTTEVPKSEHKRQRGNRRLLIVAVLCGFLYITGLARFYSSADVEGRIVDAETGEPIEGAVVVGVWQLEGQVWGLVDSGWYYGDAIHVVESVSDAEGRYHLDGFALKWTGYKRGELMDNDPAIFVFAEGYRPGGAYRGFNPNPYKGFYHVSPHIGKAIPVHKSGLYSEETAHIWSDYVGRVVEDVDCAVVDLPALKELLGYLEPQYKRIYVWGRSPYRDAEEDCREGRQ